MKWLKILFLGICSLFFLVFGIEVLVGAYELTNPQIFLMYFFSGCFIILVSVTGVLYPIFQLYAFLKPHNTFHDDQ